MIDTIRLQAKNEKHKYWKQHLNLWQGSGLSQAEYCRQNNLNKNQWGYWKKRYVQTESTTEFISLPMSQNFVLSGHSPVKLIINDQYRIELDRGFDPTTLKLVLATIQQL